MLSGTISWMDLQSLAGAYLPGALRLRRCRTLLGERLIRGSLGVHRARWLTVFVSAGGSSPT